MCLTEVFPELLLNLLDTSRQFSGGSLVEAQFRLKHHRRQRILGTIEPLINFDNLIVEGLGMFIAALIKLEFSQPKVPHFHETVVLVLVAVLEQHDAFVEKGFCLLGVTHQLVDFGDLFKCQAVVIVIPFVN